MITTARITDDWLPLPTATLAALGWREGDAIRLEVIEGSLLAVRVEKAIIPARKLGHDSEALI